MAGRTFGLSIFCLSLSVPVAAQSRFPPDAVIQDAARSFLPRDARVGIVIGLLDEDGSRRVVAVGAPGFDGRTIFEIGSVTKVFSGTLLAEMAERGELRLDEPLSALLRWGSSAVAVGSGDHATGPGDAFVRPAARARQLSRHRPGNPIRRLHRRPALRLS